MARTSTEAEHVSLDVNGWRLVKPMLDAIEALTRLDGWLGALCLASLTLLMIAGMLTRTLAGLVSWLPPDLPIAWEYSSYLMAATFTFGAAMTLRNGGHIRVRIILSRLGPQARRQLEICVSLIALAFCAFFTYALFTFTLSTYQIGDKSIASNTPLWIPRAVITFGVLLMTLQFLARVVRALLGVPLETAAFEPEEGSPDVVPDDRS
jgi:TRAP-type C4-dicarboxylate transport system permease small subunit